MTRVLQAEVYLKDATTWFEAVLGFFYPQCCQLCGTQRATWAEGYVCRQCRRRPGAIRFVEPPFCERCGLPYAGEVTTRFECGNCRDMELHFRKARAAVVASTLVLEVVRRYKYHRALWFEPFLVELLLRRAVPAMQNEQWDLVVPVPLYPVRLREREFNQAERLGRRLSAASGVPLNTKLVRRVKGTQTQTMLNRTQRAANVSGAFALRAGQTLNGERVVLVDDVLTTGATTSACARVLRDGGASDVCVWTVARGL